MSGVIDGALDFIGNTIEVIGDVFLDPILDPILGLLVPDIDLPDSVAGSSNNSLTDRNNRANIRGRIPDIVGSIPSIPNVIMQPYRIYDEGVETEIGYYCVGRDYVDITNLTDGQTLLENMSGASAAIYHPFTSPLSGAPVSIIGQAITETIYTVFKASDISSSALPAPNQLEVVIQDNGATVTSAGVITETTEDDAGFSDSFSVDDIVTLTGFTAAGINLNGNYTVTNVTKESITIDPSAVWASLPAGESVVTNESKIAPTDPQESAYTDWSYFTRDPVDKVWINAVARSGLFRQDGDGTKYTEVLMNMQVELLDDSNNPTGTVINVPFTASGKSKDTVGVTAEYILSFRSRCRVRVARTSDFDNDYDGQINDDLVWRDFYGVQNVSVTDFGNVTTILTKRVNTLQTTAIRSSELGCIATEMVYKYENGAFATTRTNNTDAMQSIIRLALDPVVGRMTADDIDLDQVAGVSAEIDGYFPIDVKHCGYTFSSSRQTGQDVITTICDAVNCTPFKEEGKIKVFFEKDNPEPRRVFTHRSKAGSESWTRNFITASSNDGVELEYIDIKTQKKEAFYVPEDESALNPRKVSVNGIVGADNARIRAHREFNKLYYASSSCRVELMPEGRFVTRMLPIAIVKGSRIKTYDGYVVAKEGLVLELSNEVHFTDGDDHSVIIKKRDGTAESIDVTEGATTRQVILAQEPAEEIYTGNSELKTEFSFGSESRHLSQVMLPSKITPSGQNATIEAINYDSRYYSEDSTVPNRAYSSGYSTGYS